MEPATFDQSNSFMKIMKIFGIVVGIHVFALVLIFANPGCSTATKPPPTPADTVAPASPSPTISVPNASAHVYTSGPESPATVSVPVSAPPAEVTAAPAALAAAEPSSATVRFTPTRPGTPAAGALVAEKVADVTPASTYVVKPGDSLWTIARKHKLTVADLTAANGIAANAALQPGRKLVIPAKSVPISAGSASTGGVGPAKAADPAPAPKAAGETVKHVVKSGETLGSIARNYGVRQADIAVANRIADPAKIQAGTELVIPGWQATGGKSAKSAKSAKGATKAATPKEEAPAPVPEPAPATPAPPVVPIIRIDDSPVTPAPKP